MSPIFSAIAVTAAPLSRLRRAVHIDDAGMAGDPSVMAFAVPAVSGLEKAHFIQRQALAARGFFSSCHVPAGWSNPNKGSRNSGGQVGRQLHELISNTPERASPSMRPVRLVTPALCRLPSPPAR